MTEHVSDAAHHEGETEDRGGETAGSARGRRELHGDRSDPREDDADSAVAIPAVNEPVAGCPVTIPARPSSPASTMFAPTVTTRAAARPA